MICIDGVLMSVVMSIRMIFRVVVPEIVSVCASGLGR